MCPKKAEKLQIKISFILSLFYYDYSNRFDGFGTPWIGP